MEKPRREFKRELNPSKYIYTRRGRVLTREEFDKIYEKVQASKSQKDFISNNKSLGAKVELVEFYKHLKLKSVN